MDAELSRHLQPPGSNGGSIRHRDGAQGDPASEVSATVAPSSSELSDISARGYSMSISGCCRQTDGANLNPDDVPCERDLQQGNARLLPFDDVIEPILKQTPMQNTVGECARLIGNIADEHTYWRASCQHLHDDAG